MAVETNGTELASTPADRRDPDRRSSAGRQAAITLALGALAVLQARAYWRALDHPHSPLEAFPERNEPVPPRLARRVVLVIFDGLRVDRSQQMPALVSLGGARRTLRVRFPTTSIPQYFAALSGIDPEASGARSNRYRKYTWPLDSVVQQASSRGMTVAAIGPHRQWFTPEFATWFRFVAFGNERYDANLLAALADGADLTIIVDDQTDVAGHRWGGTSKAYAAAALAADANLARIVAHFDLSRDAIIVTADHGHRNRGGHGGAEPEVVQVPFVAAGAGIRPGEYGDAELVDVGPTLATLLGLPAPVASRGRTMTELLPLRADVAAEIDRASRSRIEAVDQFMREAKASADRGESRWRWFRLAMLGLLVVVVASRMQWRALAAGLAYLGAFLVGAAVAGGTVSLSWGSSIWTVARALIVATAISGVVFFVVVRRVRNALLGTTLVAAAPWLVSLAVSGVIPGFFLLSPTWTAMGIWSGLPLICLAPWALLSWVRGRGPRPA